MRTRPPGDPLLILLVMDVTGDLALVDPAREAAVTAIDALPETAWVGLLRAQDGLAAVVDPTADRTKVKEGIRGLQVTGRAGLLESIEPVRDLAGRMILKSPVRLAVLYLTDSNIYNYREDYTNPVINYSDTRDLSRRFPEALIREKTSKLTLQLTASQAPVFIVHLAFLRDRMNEAYQTGLTKMAEASGGDAAFCRSVAEVPPVIASAFDKITSHWAVDFEVPAGTPPQFSIVLTAGDAGVRHRTTFATGRK